jgi:SLOG family YspA-like protein
MLADAVLERTHLAVIQRRILVTGSRDWEDSELIEKVLTQHLHPAAVLVHGDCPTGADAIAKRWWKTNGGIDEPHAADWDHCGLTCPATPHRRRRANGQTYCPGAGPRRNREMVALGAHMCYAFIRNGSSGASGCADMAALAGIPTERHYRWAR